MKVIQVGIGGMGNTWLKTVLDSSEVEYSGFVETSPIMVQQQVAQYDLDPALIFGSLSEALAAVPADGVIDVTPPRFHREVSLAAMDAGLPVLSEKPLADTFTTAQDIVTHANQTGVLHMVAQNYRYRPQAQTVKRVIASGVLGRIGSVNVDFFKGPHFGGFREEMAYPLIIDMSIHHFDLMRYFLDSDPANVFGKSWNPPWSWFRGDASAAVTLQFANDAVVSYNASWCATGQETPWNANWRIEGENGVLLLQNDQVYQQIGSADLAPVALVEMDHVSQAYLLHEFYEAVTHGKAPATTCQDNIKSLAIVFNTIQSFETGALVQF